MGPATLKQDLWDKTRVDITEKQAQDYLDKFFHTYPKVETYINNTIAFVMRYGWTFTYTGRRRRFPYLVYDRKGRNRAGRQAVNARIQTTSSDVVTRNIINVNAGYIEPNHGRMLLGVHDSMVFQIPKGLDKTEMRKSFDHLVLEKTAEEFPWLPVPWKYDVDIGPSYGETSALDA